MDVQATTKYLPISPQKLRLVCDVVRGKAPYDAVAILKHMPHKGAGLLLKTLSSAIANAENNFNLDATKMVIATIKADEAPRRNWRIFGARGRFKPIIKRNSHLTVILSEVEAAAEAAGKK
jgi:large subunit ribosomal protein L22